MEETLKSLGWSEIYPDTMKRLNVFRDAFRENFTVYEISDKRLNECVAKTFAIHGQGEVYNIYSQLIHILKASNTDTIDIYKPEKIKDLKFNVISAFKEFLKAFEETVPETYVILMPQSFIRLFIDYLFAQHIKGK
jgi:hypothetical protein